MNGHESAPDYAKESDADEDIKNPKVNRHGFRLAGSRSASDWWEGKQEMSHHPVRRRRGVQLSKCIQLLQNGHLRITLKTADSRHLHLHKALEEVENGWFDDETADWHSGDTEN
ncbi:hypothetical protein M433DRAFT_137513 [Acidomyces richmondensis BFW]|nr:hypothetical protein M433DRAFT_137513 [Acidomyces richmondensis BFW]